MNLQEELKALKERIAELEEQEFPKNYDDYWYIDTTGDVYTENWHGFSFEIAMLEIGNIYKTKEQAEFAVEKLKVEAELRKFGKHFENGKSNIEFYYDHEFDGIMFNSMKSSQTQGAIYFESKDKAQQAIDTVGEDRIKKYIFGVED